MGARGKTLGCRVASALKDRVPAGGTSRLEASRDAGLSVLPKGRFDLPDSKHL